MGAQLLLRRPALVAVAGGGDGGVRALALGSGGGRFNVSYACYAPVAAADRAVVEAAVEREPLSWETGSRPRYPWFVPPAPRSFGFQAIRDTAVDNPGLRPVPRVTAPYGALAATSAALPSGRILLAISPRRRRRRRIAGGLCGACGYDLRGNVSGVCPECGKAK